MQPDVLMLDRIGGSYTHASLLTGGLGGSEIELLQVAHGLTAKGHRVVVANGVETVQDVDGVQYVPHAQAWQHVPKKALYLQRFSSPETQMQIPAGVRVVVRANDVYCPPYDVHRKILESGRAGLVANTQWQANQFGFAKEKTIIHPMLEPTPKAKKQRGLFVFASGAMKGLEETVALWCAMKHRHPQMQGTRLAVVCPGWGDPRPLTGMEQLHGVEYVGNPTPQEYRRLIAKAEGTFTVLTMPETFGCFAALAERAGTRNHILCLAGRGGLSEAVHDVNAVTEDPKIFEAVFLESLGHGLKHSCRTRADTHLMDDWSDALRLNGCISESPCHITPDVRSIEATFADDPTLSKNQESLGPFFGEFLSQLRANIAPGGSEFGTGLMLFALAVSIQARHIVEIGRFKGFSTRALGAALRLCTMGWTEPKLAEQRPDVDYAALHDADKGRSLTSIDPAPMEDATALYQAIGMTAGVELINKRSDEVTILRPIDLLFIDGSHILADLRNDLQRFVPWVRPGGYFVLHDYFGWFTTDGRNGSPTAQVISEDLGGCDRILIDTHYASLVIFRKTTNLTERWELPPALPIMPARADGRPTVGLVLIAKGDEVSTVATRAIASAKRAGVDCCTVVCDAQDAAADVARSLGADVVIRQTPSHDWGKGIGWIAAARNDALTIAERRTDYLLMLDADDHLQGTLPTVLDQDAYEVLIHDAGLEYPRIQLFRSVLGWRYHGIIHETLQGTGRIGRLESVHYLRGKSTYGAQDQDPPPIKFSKHAALAHKWLLDHPDDTRMQFYLARSYHDAGRLDEALVAYEKRLSMSGWESERGYAAFQMGKILHAQGKDPSLRFLQSHGIDGRAEPLVALSRWYRDDARRQFSTAYLFARRAAEIPQPTDAVFLQPSVYVWEAAAEEAICAYWIGQKLAALQGFQALLARVPASQRVWCESQIAICKRDLAQGAA